MYKIIGADGKEYGPVPLEKIQEWVSQGRINAETRMQGPSNPEWVPAGKIAELQALFSPPSLSAPPPVQASAPVSTSPPPQPISAPSPIIQGPPGVEGKPGNGLAITSFVLGIASFVLCLGILSGIPAIICGHIAYNRSRRSPTRYGGGGFAIAGLVLGYVSLVFTVLTAAMLLPAVMQAKTRASSIQCSSHLRQVGLAFRVWSVDHQDQFPFNVSTNSGGTKELCAPLGTGFDENAYKHFSVLSNELGKTSLLICPQDSSKSPAPDFEHLTAANVTYELRSGPELLDNSSEVLAECPIHGTRLLCNGNIEEQPRKQRFNTKRRRL